MISKLLGTRVLVWFSSFYIYLVRINENEKIPSTYESLTGIRYKFNRSLYLIAILAIIALRFTVAFAGAQPEYYTVNIGEPADNIDFGNITMEKINSTTYHAPSDYNEMELLNDLKVPLYNSCRYYTVSWNIYSYL